MPAHFVALLRREHIFFHGERVARYWCAIPAARDACFAMPCVAQSCCSCCSRCDKRQRLYGAAFSRIGGAAGVVAAQRRANASTAFSPLAAEAVCGRYNPAAFIRSMPVTSMFALLPICECWFHALPALRCRAMNGYASFLLAVPPSWHRRLLPPPRRAMLLLPCRPPAICRPIPRSVVACLPPAVW